MSSRVVMVHWLMVRAGEVSECLGWVAGVGLHGQAILLAGGERGVSSLHAERPRSHLPATSGLHRPMHMHTMTGGVLNYSYLTTV